MLLKGNKGAKLSSNRFGYTRDINFLFATGAAHEGKSNSKRSPFVLEKLNDAIGVEDMTTREL